MRNSRFTSVLLAGVTTLAALAVGVGPAVADPSDPAAVTASPDASPDAFPEAFPGGQDVEVFAEDGAISRTKVPSASPSSPSSP